MLRALLLLGALLYPGLSIAAECAMTLGKAYVRHALYASGNGAVRLTYRALLQFVPPPQVF